VNRTAAVTETTSRVMEWVRGKNEHGRPLVAEDIVSETLYFERLRLKRPIHAPGREADQAFWRDIARNLRASEAPVLLERIVQRYADEIIGHFNPLLFGALKRYGAPSLSLALNSLSPLKLMESLRHLESLEDNVVVRGEVAAFLKLAKLGTVVLVPTHVSNFDSVVLGFALARLGLPPFLYGAGYNLFKNPLLAPFLGRLGAYTVDREKKAPLYKHTLKTYATISMEHGDHHIFFPGGTRSRSGRIETHLKKGLMGCGITAYAERVRRGVHRPQIFFVPCTLTYQVVLEAETLIDDHLAEAGKSRYIIIDDESSRLSRVAQFMGALLRHESRIHVHLLPALDPFGNRVTETGESVDQHGRRIDITGYLKRGGAIVHDQQRDEEFTSELSQRIVAMYPQGNVVAPTHAVAYVLFALLEEEHPEWDLYRLLKGEEAHPGFTLDVVRVRLAHVQQRLKALAASGALALEPLLESGSADDVLARALVHFAVYHARPLVERRGMRIFVLQRPLVYYYRNRLVGYDFADAEGGAAHAEW
jgi:glycerol-3-phosphate O-acyltransferase